MNDSQPGTFDVAVIGAGAAGVAAALEAARLGASVALIESGQPGGTCVNQTCIPTTALLDSLDAFVRAREPAIAGVFTVGELFSLGRANDRAAALTRSLSSGVEGVLRRAGVRLINGRARFRDADTLEVAGFGTLAARSVIIASGAQWKLPSIPGLEAARLVTVDVVQSWREAPASCVVLGGGPSQNAFAIEYATLLALAGAEVTLALPGQGIVPGLDPDLQPAARGSLEALGVRVVTGATPASAGEGQLRLESKEGALSAPAEFVLVADPREPGVEGLAQENAGLPPGAGPIPVDARCATAAPGIYAAGDVTGQGMFSSTAAHQGQVAGANAAGGNRRCQVHAIPFLIHTIPQIATVGHLPAGDSANDRIISATIPMEGSAWSVAKGNQPGVVRVHADRVTGEILSVQSIGTGAHEIVSLASALLQVEATVDQLAALIPWHPSPVELLAGAAGRLPPRHARMA
jgi:dihydrolipoamide dehydrogenase